MHMHMYISLMVYIYAQYNAYVEVNFANATVLVLIRHTNYNAIMHLQNGSYIFAIYMHTHIMYSVHL